MEDTVSPGQILSVPPLSKEKTKGGGGKRETRNQRFPSSKDKKKTLMKFNIEHCTRKIKRFAEMLCLANTNEGYVNHVIF